MSIIMVGRVVWLLPCSQQFFTFATLICGSKTIHQERLLKYLVTIGKGYSTSTTVLYWVMCAILPTVVQSHYRSIVCVMCTSSLLIFEKWFCCAHRVTYKKRFAPSCLSHLLSFLCLQVSNSTCSSKKNASICWIKLGVLYVCDSAAAQLRPDGFQNFLIRFTFDS